MSRASTIAQTNRKLLYVLERELAELDYDIERITARKTTLQVRRAEVVAGIDGLRKVINTKERIE